MSGLSPKAKLQSELLDTDYYDRFFGPGAYGPAHAAHMVHPALPPGAVRPTAVSTGPVDSLLQAATHTNNSLSRPICTRWCWNLSGI
jgi:hypothetical protein